MDVEVLPPDQNYYEEPPRARFVHLRAPGIFAPILAILTMLAAATFGFFFLFGTTVAAALAAYVAWPLVFTPQFTQWAFGEPRASFWKLFLLFLAVGFIVKAFRRR